MLDRLYSGINETVIWWNVYDTPKNVGSFVFVYSSCIEKVIDSYMNTSCFLIFTDIYTNNI